MAFLFCSKECANAFYLAVLADGIIAGDDPSVLAGDDHDARSKWIVGLKLLPEDDLPERRERLSTRTASRA